MLGLDDPSAPRALRIAAARGVIDESALQRWLGMARSSETVDVSLCLALLETLFETIDACLFVVAADGEILAANSRGGVLLASSEEDILSFLAMGTATPPNAAAPISSNEGSGMWSNGSLRAWRRWFALSTGAACALVVVELVRTSVEQALDRAVDAWALTARQAGVLRAVLDGMSNKEIASSLQLSDRTVEMHLTTIFEKVGVDNCRRLIAKTWSLGRPGLQHP